MARIMTESEFHRAVDAVLARIESAAEADERLDVELEGGILTILCADASRVIVGRAPRVRLSAKAETPRKKRRSARF